MAERSGPALLIPPPLVFAAACGAMYALHRFIPASRLDFPYAENIGLVIGLMGLLLFLMAGAGFVSRKTTVSPHHPEKTSALVTDGVYSISRNPMYLGMALLTLAFAAIALQPLGLILLAAAIWYITRFQIIPEENVLAEKFGKDYTAYRAKVRRWI
ncbi:MAG: isoprenylcysteine carboxylmethyltransferase family protein [Pseudomonadota bacterium]